MLFFPKTGFHPDFVLFFPKTGRQFSTFYEDISSKFYEITVSCQSVKYSTSWTLLSCREGGLVWVEIPPYRKGWIVRRFVSGRIIRLPIRRDGYPNSEEGWVIKKLNAIERLRGAAVDFRSEKAGRSTRSSHGDRLPRIDIIRSLSKTRCFTSRSSLRPGLCSIIRAMRPILATLAIAPDIISRSRTQWDR